MKQFIKFWLRLSLLTPLFLMCHCETRKCCCGNQNLSRYINNGGPIPHNKELIIPLSLNQGIKTGKDYFNLEDYQHKIIKSYELCKGEYVCISSKSDSLVLSVGKQTEYERIQVPTSVVNNITFIGKNNEMFYFFLKGNINGCTKLRVRIKGVHSITYYDY